MSNGYFQFKQFIIHQEACAMKVCTDACLFGAWVGDKLRITEPESVLDIGTGTGLLSLMVAQKNSAHISAVEIDPAAAKQAADNFKASAWVSRLEVINTEIQHYQPAGKYDFIICNPPFFDNHLKSKDPGRNVALHSQQLSGEELIKSITSLVKAAGSFALLLPFQRTLHFEQLASTRAFTWQKK